ncbi:MAG: TetR/AcrR family transcriptional regulator [Frankiales bacterium]|nr:TetR/AcrR family transcriptional regulator [Frankiales bacterium]
MHTTRDLLLDAAADAVLSGAEWDRVRMVDVARAAGVSRQTLYVEFGSRDALAQALAMREAQRFMDGADAARAGHEGTPGEAIAAACEWTLTEAASNPLLKAVLTDDTGSLLPLLTTRAEALLTATREHCAAYLSGRWPDLDRGLVLLVAEAVNRLTLSHLVLPGGRPDEVAADLARLVDSLLPGKSQP